MMAVSQWTLRIPGRPDLPGGCTAAQLMAFGTRRRDKVHWLLAQSEEEVRRGLPPPPQAPKPPDEKVSSPKPIDPINPRLPPVPFYPAMPGEVPPPYNGHVTPAAGGGGGGGGVFPQNGFARFPAQPLPPPVGATILVRDRTSTGGDFAAGVLMGAAVSGWGHGWGWSGGGGGGGGGGGLCHQHDVVDNHCDVGATVINQHDVTYVNGDYYGDLGFDDGDYGMDCGGDFGF
ncbi:translation initiation factor IF-2 [Bacillus rossius redtenbacheri]|uniref:translation initiation factor IF-2 n=1 Tax=Bacillus rossius redtenbacheri TaxID=93214 RepID=UPI002FDD2ABF